MKIFAYLLKKPKQFLHFVKKFKQIFANLLKKKQFKINILRKNPELIFANYLLKKPLILIKNNSDKF